MLCGKFGKVYFLRFLTNMHPFEIKDWRKKSSVDDKGHKRTNEKLRLFEAQGNENKFRNRQAVLQEKQE